MYSKSSGGMHGAYEHVIDREGHPTGVAEVAAWFIDAVERHTSASTIMRIWSVDIP